MAAGETQGANEGREGVKKRLKIMQNREFDKRIREMMENHQEPLPSDSWDKIVSTLEHRRAGKIYIRRSLYAVASVAATLLLFLFIKGGPSSDVIQGDKGNTITADLIKPKIETLVPGNKITPVNLPLKREKGHYKQPDKSGVITEETSTKTETSLLAEKAVNEDITVEGQTAVQKQTAVQEKTAAADKSEKVTVVKEPLSAKSKGKLLGLMEESADRFKGLFNGKKITYGLSTNYTPSVYSKSINLLSVSLGYQNDLVPASIREYVQSQSVTDSKYSMPLTFGFQGQVEINDKISIGSGLNYSLLVSNYQDFTPTSRLDVQQSLHYMGIPANIYFNLLRNDRLKLYVMSGVALEKGLSANYRIVENGIKRNESNKIEGLQLSMGAGIGAELKLSHDLGLYFDPSLAYFFSGKQPESIRTAQPLQYKFEIGMRFNL